MLNTALSDDCQAGHAFQRIYCNTWLTLSTHGLDLQSVSEGTREEKMVSIFIFKNFEKYSFCTCYRLILTVLITCIHQSQWY